MNRLKTNNISALLLLVGFGLLLTAVLDPIPFGATPMPAGDIILREAAHEIGTANLVTAVVLAYRGFDTLGELTILFVAATAAGLVLGPRREGARLPSGRLRSARGSGSFVSLPAGGGSLHRYARPPDAGGRIPGGSGFGGGLFRAASCRSGLSFQIPRGGLDRRGGREFCSS